MQMGKLDDEQVTAIRLWLKAYPSRKESPLLVKPSAVHVRTTLLHGGPIIPSSFAKELDLVHLSNGITSGTLPK